MAGFWVQLLKMAGVPLLELCPRSSFPLRPAAVLLINISDGLDFLGGRTPAHWSDQPWDKFIFQEIEKMWVCKNTRWDNILDRPLPFCLPPNFSANAEKKTFFLWGVIPYSYNCVSDPATEMIIVFLFIFYYYSSFSHGLFPSGSVPAHNGALAPYRLLGPRSLTLPHYN